MIPGRTLLPGLLAWALTGVLAALRPDLTVLWSGSALALLAAAWIDLRAALRRAPPAVERRVAGSLALGAWAEVTLRLRASAGRGFTVAVFDHHPPGMEVEGLPQTLRVPDRGWVDVRYRVRPRTRGEHVFEPAELLIDSPLRVWRRRVRAGGRGPVRVYPNFAEITRYALLATDDRLSQMGIRSRAQRGEGLEFHQLREYQQGDSLRQIDWKATARMRRLISREYQSERDQQVLLLLDCGRRMLVEDGELSHFDHTLNSALLLAHVALRQGDRVGLMTFAGSDRYLAPGKGSATLAAFLDRVYDLQPTPRSPDYVRAATAILARVRKRSLVVILTNLRDEDLDDVLLAAQLLRRRHLVLLASLRERVVGEMLSRPVEHFHDALDVAAAHRYLLARRRAHDTLRQHGVLTLDVDPERLPSGMVNRYLDIKRGGVL